MDDFSKLEYPSRSRKRREREHDHKERKEKRDQGNNYAKADAKDDRRQRQVREEIDATEDCTIIQAMLDAA